MIYPKNLAKLPPFELWFATTIVKDMAKGVDVREDVISINAPPLEIPIAYLSMYAIGNHLRVASVEHHLSCSDSGVVATFE